RNVEGERPSATGANDVDEIFALAVGEREGAYAAAHDVDESGELRRLLAARGHHREQSRGFHFRCFAGKDLLEYTGGLFASESGAVLGHELEQFFQRSHISLW